MDGSRRTTAYRRTKSGGDEDVRVGSPLRMDHLVCSFHSGFHWGTQQKRLDEDIHRLMSPCFPCEILKASRGGRGPARGMQDVQDCQI